ncbi:condensin-2 complex subunit D3 [Nilaparvata lugens]|uniref:condensin-2 complex subunit D3 n=1 Tax=Nilaparvata lugens TaxID=108931 RepID=UPI00193D1645|nr:condensin-2 complex subunit D3 [Nilaparvata lugens]XP_039287680.1 condensin-2 complex subunit D3 [Nilaparvata lugens]
MDLYEVFSKFELDLLPNDWVKEIWQNQFSELVELPPAYEEHLETVNIRQLLNAACTAIKSWLGTGDMIDNTELTSSSPSKLNHTSMYRSRLSEAHSIFQKSTTEGHSTMQSGSSTLSGASTICGLKSWQTLITNNLQHKPLICLISNFILTAKENPNDERIQQISLGATNLYFILLAVPGSKVYNIFNPVLYAHAIESLKICSALDETAKPTSASNNAKNRRKRAEEDSDEDGEEVGNSKKGPSISAAGKINLTRCLNVLLNDLMYSLERFKLKGQEDSLILTIQILVLLTRLEKKQSNFLIHSPNQVSVTSLSRNAYIVMKNLCEPDHNNVEETVRFIMRELLPSILVIGTQPSLITPKEAGVIKDHSINFIKTLLLTIDEPAYKAVMSLVQHLCIRVPDRAEPRAKAVSIVFEVLQVLPSVLYAKVVVWMMQLSHAGEVKNRIFGLEIVSKLLFTIDNFTSTLGNRPHIDENNKEHPYEKYTTFANIKFLLATVLSRCKDHSSRVRAKALTILASIIPGNAAIKHVIDDIFVNPYKDDTSPEDSVIYKKDFFNLHHFLQNFEEIAEDEFNPLPGAKAILELLETSVFDEKVFVRKSALQVLANLFLYCERWMTPQLLELMVSNCRDISVSVRKMLVQCLTELIERFPKHPKLPRYWVRGVFPLLADQEVKSQEKALEVLEGVILKNIVSFDRMNNAHHNLPWIILDIVGDLKLQKLFNFACHKWILNGVIKSPLLKNIISHVGTQHNNAAWFVLATISEYMSINNPEFILEYFQKNIHSAAEADIYCSQLVVETMFLNWTQFSDEDLLQLCTEMLSSLNHFITPLHLISRYMDICYKITEHATIKIEQHGEEEAQQICRTRVQEWAGKLIDSAERFLEKHIGANAEAEISPEDEDLMCQYIHTLGDAILISPRKNLKSLDLLKNLLESSECSVASEKETNKWKGKVCARVSAVAIITLGKISLQREKTATSLVPLFGKLLSHRSKPEIKINTMIALTDLCTKYTSIVEKLLPNMCVCLRDNDLLVRENTLTLLIQLMQEDYLKLRCPIFFHLLYMLLDEDPTIKDMISGFLVNSLLVKQKNVMSQHFVESLFHYNQYTMHAVYSKNLMSAAEAEVFSLSGDDNAEKRRFIYRYMLEHMQDDHRFKATYNICVDILAGVSDDKIELKGSGIALLKDALYVLSSQEIRLSHLQSNKHNEDDDDDEDINVAQVITNIAKKTLVSQVVKKNVIEHTVPIIIKLKHKLKQLKSPLVKDLMAYLKELMKDYKTEINEILAADKELAAEVAFDLESSMSQSSGDESGDDLMKAVTDKTVLKQIMAQAVVQVERLSAIYEANEQEEQVNTQQQDNVDANQQDNASQQQDNDKDTDEKNQGADSQVETET